MNKLFISLFLRRTKNNKLFYLSNFVLLFIGTISYNFLLLYIIYESGFDKFHKNGNNIYRVQNDRYNNQKLIIKDAFTYPGVGPFLKESTPEIKSTLRLHPFPSFILYKEKPFREKKIFFSDKDFFSFFSFQLIDGNPDSCLDGAQKVVISKEMAVKYFKSENPIGQVIETFVPLVVSGVFEKNEQSHLDIDFLVSFETFLDMQGDFINDDWFFSNFYTYILVNNNSEDVDLERKISHILKEQIEKKLSEKRSEEFKLQKISSIHLTSRLSNEIKENGNLQLIVLLVIVAILLLIVTIVNYISFLFAKDIERAKEIGMRKILGESRVQILKSFLVEYLSQILLTYIIAILIIYYVSTNYYYLVGLPINFFVQIVFDNFYLWILVTFLSLLIIGIAYVYPSLLIISYKPASIIKGDILNLKKDFLRKILITGQITIFGGLLFFLILVIDQVSFYKKRDLGFKIEQTLVIEDFIPDSLGSIFKNNILQFPEIKGISNSNVIPGSTEWWKAQVRKVSSNSKDFIDCNLARIDEDFLKVMKIDLLEGRNFIHNNVSDKNGIIINQSLFFSLGYENYQEAIGEKLMIYNKEKKIIGIMKNYHHQSLKEPFQPIGFILTDRREQYYSINLETNNLKNSINQIKLEWGEIFEGRVFDYFFLEDYFNNQYKNEDVFLRNLLFFTVITLLIVFTGTISFTIHNIKKSKKEIAVRKVFGGSIISIVFLFVKDFFFLIIISIIISLPVTIYVSKFWFENFSFKIQVSVSHIILSYLLFVFSLIFIIVMQIFLSTRENPVKALKN